MASALADAHIEGQRRLRALTRTAVANIWGGLAGYDRANVDEWLSRVLPLVLTSQRASVALTEAFLAQSLGRQPLGVNTDDIVLGLRAGTPPETVYERPFVTVWTALKAGTVFADAVNAGAARATSTAEMDVQLAARGTFAAVQREDTTIRGYQRVADGDACAFCLMIDGAFVKSADAMALHNRCGCGLEPVTGGRVTASPVPDGVAVHDHGELGPVLVDPSHEFTSLADI